jgi:hypothetical protein
MQTLTITTSIPNGQTCCIVGNLDPQPLATFARAATQHYGVEIRTTGLAACDGESAESPVEETREQNRSHAGRQFSLLWAQAGVGQARAIMTMVKKESAKDLNYHAIDKDRSPDFLCHTTGENDRSA